MSTHSRLQLRPELTIAAAQVVSFAGDNLEALHAAVLAGMSGARLQTSSVYAVGDEYSEAAPVLAASSALQGSTRREILFELVYRALSPLMSKALEKSDESPSISILLPMQAEPYVRAQRIDFEAIKSDLCQAIPAIDPDKLGLVPHHTGATAEIIRLQQLLNAGETKQAILCGADSLINGLTYQAMAEVGTLATKNYSNGIVPGEGAAALLLQLPDPKQDQDNPPLANLLAMASVPEPHVGRAGDSVLKGAAEALRQASKRDATLLSEAPLILTGGAQGTVGELEWHQLERQLWPETLEEEQRIAMMLGEVDAPVPNAEPRPQRLNLTAVMGDLGAAALPMELAVACEHFRYQVHMARYGFPTPRPLFVLENGDYPMRGAVCLQPPASKRSATASNNKATNDQRSTPHGRL